MMKINSTIVSLILIIITYSCSSDDDFNGYNHCQNAEKNKIDSVQIPQSTMSVFTVQTIKTYSTYAGNCEDFNTYDYVRSGMTRLVTAYKCVGSNCTSTTTDARVSYINFRPEEAGTYLFRFYTGIDSQGNNTYIDRQIIVTED